MSLKVEDQDEGLSHIRRPLTLVEKLHLAALVPIALGNIIYSFAYRTYKDPSSTLDSTMVRRRLLLSLTSVLELVPIGFIQAIIPTTSEKLRSHFAKSTEFTHNEIVVRPRGYKAARLHIITPKGADVQGPCLLYFHGGGFYLPLSAGHITMVTAIAKEAGISTVCFLEYTLTPVGKYPTQLAQASAALSYLVHERSIRLDQIVVGGDSAGASLTLNLLAHLAKPHPDIDPIVPASTSDTTKLAGALAISPRCANNSLSDSYKRNLLRDVITPTSTAFVMRTYEPRPEIWAASNEDLDFWRVPGHVRVKQFMFVGGEEESFIDDMAVFARNISAIPLDQALKENKTDNIIFFEAKKEIHDQSLLDFGQGKTDGVMTQAIMAWAGGLIKPTLQGQ
ncbi:Alpha/Beta hydrolase protein [Naematelia encephala]|uniref:Alpha/Beta hydrolase protein n=1 Tax=Naematelia encephala TaxID=71784 RepID=A0A1Y2BJ45_9TREE|nr:Alpha/Beta hydrolase protein [Naematelia encephala]